MLFTLNLSKTQNHTQMKKSILIFSLLFTAVLVQAQSDIIEQLKNDNKTDLSLFFTPSTLRMINLQNNEEFDDMVKDIKKMTFLKLNRNQFDLTQFYDVVSELQKEEDLEEYIVIDGKEQKLYLLGKESPTSTVAMAYFQGDYYAVDIAGSISISELPKLYEQLSQGDETLKNDFANIFNLVNSANDFGNKNKRDYDDEIDD